MHNPTGSKLASGYQSGPQKPGAPKDTEFLLAKGNLYCSLSLHGATRKYHGMLVERANGSLYVHAINLLESVNDRDPILMHPEISHDSVRLVYSLPKGLDGKMTKEISMLEDCAGVSIKYTFETSEPFLSFEVLPLVTYRNAHALNPQADLSPSFGNRWFRTHRLLSGSNMQFDYSPKWHELFYEREYERGYESSDNAFSPGAFTAIGRPRHLEIRLMLVEVPSFQFPVSGLQTPNPLPITQNSKPQTIKVISAQLSLYNSLVRSLGTFVVSQAGLNKVVAGYHWFDEWARDTLIFLNGYMAVSKDYATVLQQLEQLMSVSHNGLLSTTVIDGRPVFNSSDAQLLYINLAYGYFNETQDLEFLRHAYPFLKKLLTGYIEGTGLYSMDTDFLINCRKAQTTWMDTKYTPRTGKCVEINALWHNALCIMDEFSTLLGAMDNYTAHILGVRNSFPKFHGDGWLRDTLEDDSLRPNQLFAAALPYPAVGKEWMKKIVESTQRHLLTPVGIRTLPLSHRDYSEYYLGSENERDRSYHNGMIWPWLLGLYHDAVQNLAKHGTTGSYLDIKTLAAFSLPGRQPCPGYIPELYDGFLKPAGCVAQAWSCSEIARILHDHMVNNNQCSNNNKAEITVRTK